jgi:amino acid adenylation domain-containing protein/non-ribosomal peptide synthase protein (TIGR01720 family)
MDHKIAIIGMAGRFPDAKTTREFYLNLREAKCSISEISADRLKKTTLPPDGKYQRRGYMKDIELFDYKHFNIALGEAMNMDPHQRQLLEVVYEAMENAGYNPDDFSGTDTAVYVADKNMNYYQHADQFDPTLVTGNSSEFLAARINRVFNVTGGVAVIDTSCSSGLVALHNACNELILENASQALVCAANMELFPFKEDNHHIEVDSPDGFSIPFTAESNGMVYGEAVACVLLKPLQRAIEDGDNIQAVICASAVNNNAARSASLTAPDSVAQAEVIKKAWKKAGIHPEDLGFIEAHGSGTQLGDSLEIAGLNMAFKSFTEAKQICPVATVKGNIGHSRSAAGLAGFVRAVLAVKNKEILPSVYNGHPNPFLNLNNSAVYISEQLKPWEVQAGKKRYAGVSSIGFSGTNCHIVLEEAPAVKPADSSTSQPRLVLLSSWTREGMDTVIADMIDCIEMEQDIDINDISYTLGKGRKHYTFRKAYIASSREELIRGLRESLNLNGEIKADKQQVKKLIFIFSDGGQIPLTLADSLSEQYPAFKQSYQALTEKIPAGTGSNDPRVIRFIFQIAFYELLLQHGIGTKNLLGIGTGRIITRVINNLLSLEEGLKEALAIQAEDGTNLEQRVNALIAKEVGDGKTVFVEIGLGSIISGLMYAHEACNKKFFLFNPAAQSVRAILEQTAFALYEHHYEINAAFFNYQAGRRIELPAHVFTPTRCWIREEPRKEAAPAFDKASPSNRVSSNQPAADQLTLFISACWKEVLNMDHIAADANFFELGGDSLQATKVINRIRKSLGVRIDFEDLFDYPVFSDFRQLIAGQLSVSTILLFIWKEVLKTEGLNVEDNFFDLGGHSLLANQILNRVKVQMGIQLNFEDFFLYPTITAMAAFIEQKQTADKGVRTKPVIEKVNPAESYPLSHAQRRLWILSQLEEGSVAYNECNAFSLEGALDVEMFRNVINTLIERHESLRTCFITTNNGPRQVINPLTEQYRMGYLNLDGHADGEAAAFETAALFANTPFNLETGPLFKTLLIRLSAKKYVLLMNVHHIVFDEWSYRVLITEMSELYNAARNNKVFTLAPLRIQYKDYSAWMNDKVESNAIEPHETYWMKQFQHGVPVMELPTDFVRPVLKTYHGSRLHVAIPAEMKHFVESYSRANGASLFMTLLASVKLLFYKYTGQTELVVGTPVAGREDLDLENQVGFYANTLALKTIIDPAADFNGLIANVKETVVNAYEHQVYPFDLLVEKLDLKADRSRLPVFDVMVLYRRVSNEVAKAFAMEGLNIDAFHKGVSNTKFDLSVNFTDMGDHLFMTITYNTDLFLPATIEKMYQHYINLLQTLAVNDKQSLSQVQYIGASELTSVMHSFANGGESLLSSPGLICLFEEQVRLNPAAIALCGNGFSMSYAELSEKVNGLAAHLITACKVQPQEPVAMLMDRSPNMLVAILAIIKAGAAYMPISTVEPDNRIAAMLKVAGVKTILMDDDAAGAFRFGTEAYTVFPVNQWINQPASYQDSMFPLPAENKLACILYTSGTTGVPKGVALEHKGFVNMIGWMRQQFSFQPGDVILQRFSYCFDFSIYEIFGALCNGCSLHLPGDEILDDTTSLIQTIEQAGITHLSFTPAELQLFLKELPFAGSPALKNLKWITAGGEILKPLLAQLFHSKLSARLLNIYGPTETSVLVSAYEVTAGDTHISVGKPIPGVQIYILDKEMNPLPVGIPGQLYIAGKALARTYLNGSDEGKFMTHIFADGRSVELYNTGDICRWLPDGTIDFIGRKDHLLKVNGFRVEANEIENMLYRHKDVNEVAVIGRGKEDGTSEIAAYMVRRKVKTVSSTEAGAASTPAAKEEKMPVITSEELNILAGFNTTDQDFPLDILLHQYVEQWAAQTPEAIAVSCGSRQLSYRGLNEKANALAYLLLNAGISAEEIVPVYCRRSIDLLIAIIAIFKAGGVYLPLAIDSPEERLMGIIGDCNARFLLTTGDTLNSDHSLVDAKHIETVVANMIDIATATDNSDGITNPGIDIQPDRLAYIIFTSGSTGKPKGAMIEHRGMMNHLHIKAQLLSLDNSSTIIQNAPQAFDISIWQFLVALLHGGQTIVYPDAVVENLAAFAAGLIKDRPSILELVPSYLSALLDIMEGDQQFAGWNPAYLLVTGETIKPSLVQRWFAAFPSIPLVNAYGPTEASDDITHHIMYAYDENCTTVPIGKTVANMKIYVLNEQMQHCPIGYKGEIYVAGIGVGRGYFNDPAKTSAVFLEDPFQPGVRMYKTGDIGRYTANGCLEFFGRKDQQIKIHGHRIEIGEIEHTIIRVSAVEDAVVLCWKEENGNASLAAYLKVPENYIHNAEAIKESLKACLPPYMVPSYILFLNEFPLTANGKTDRKAFADPLQLRRNRELELELKAYLLTQLPEYMIPHSITILDKMPLTPTGKTDRRALLALIPVHNREHDYKAPVTPLQESLCAIWEEILQRNPIGIEDNFFEIGGHSLKGMRLISAIERELGKRISLRDIFSHTTVSQQAILLESGAAVHTMNIERIEDQPYYKVSHAQRRMWVLSQLGDIGNAYHIPGGIELLEAIDTAAWEQAWKMLIARHEILRTTFCMADGELCQQVHEADTMPVHFTQVDVSGNSNREAELSALYQQQATASFDLEAGPLLRASLIKLDTTRFVFIYTLHHIIADEWSLGVLSRELLALYEGCRIGVPVQLNALTVQYRDYAAWQHAVLSETTGRDYWKQQLGGEIPVLELPLDVQRPAVKTYNGSSVMQVVEGLQEKIQLLAVRAGTTVFMNLLATVQAFLYRYTGQEDIIIGIPMAGRGKPELESQVGLYLNTLAIRNNCKGNRQFNEWLQEVKINTLGAFEHQDYPFDQLIEELDLKRDLSRSPVFDVMMVLHDGDINVPAAQQLRVKAWGSKSTASKCDLSFHFTPLGNDLSVGINYNTDLFSGERAALILSHYINLLNALMDHTDVPVQSVPYIATDEQSKLLQDFQGAGQVLNNETVITCFEKIVKENGAATAVVCGREYLNYTMLNAAANQLAAYLQRVYGVKQGDTVALKMDRSVNMVVAMLGIIKTGASYLPVDKDFPADRIQYMLSDSGSRLLLCDKDLEVTVPVLIWNEAFASILRQEQETGFAVPFDSNSTVYTIYTSGSTGLPKGVKVTHHGLVNYVKGFTEAHGVTAADSGLLASSVAFDLGYTCLWPMLLNGGVLQLYPEADYWEPKMVLELLSSQKISVVKLTPSHFQLLVQELTDNRLPVSLRLVVLGGEKIRPADIEAWWQYYPAVRFVNHYGPTETTIGVLTQGIVSAGATGLDMNIADFSRCPVLGRPLGAHRVYVLDPLQQLCGIGIPGEIYIGGPGLSAGYVNKPELTAEKFIPDPFQSSGRIYRTGDKGRWLPGGKMEFLGRIDDQVQVKGYRVEIGEIEQVILRHPQVKEAAVRLWEETSGVQLAAYIVNKDALSIAELRLFLKDYLPHYMIPVHIVELDAIPLTPNGKADRKKLPRPEIVVTSGDMRPASGKEEALLVQAFERLLGTANTGIDGNFFELGGDSIKAIQIASWLYRNGYKLEVKDIFHYPVIESLALRMQPLQRLADQGMVTGEVPLTPVQHDFFERNLYHPHHYNQSIMLTSAERFEPLLLQQVIEQLQLHHDALRMVYQKTGDQWIQQNLGMPYPVKLLVTDLRLSENPSAGLTAHAQQLQRSILLEEGPLFMAGLYQLPDGDRLLLAAHHLVVDGISWRIILEDIGSLYEQLRREEKMALPLKSDSFKTWALALEEYAGTEKFLKEQAYWFDILTQEVSPLPTEKMNAADPSVKNSGSVQFRLNEAGTELLLMKVHEAYRTEINDILLAALSLSLEETFKRDKVWVTLEGHGREEIIDGIDITRTVGWFTTTYPVLLQAVSGKDLGMHIKLTKEYLRGIPNKGIGYGILKYLHSQQDKQKISIQPAIIFNYLGQFDTDVSNASFVVASENGGDVQDPNEKIIYPIAFSAFVSEGKFNCTASFNQDIFSNETISKLMKGFESRLVEICTFCSTALTSELTPSDLGYKNMSIHQLETFFD